MRTPLRKVINIFFKGEQDDNLSLFFELESGEFVRHNWVATGNCWMSHFGVVKNFEMLKPNCFEDLLKEIARYASLEDYQAFFKVGQIEAYEMSQLPAFGIDDECVAIDFLNYIKIGNKKTA